MVDALCSHLTFGLRSGGKVLKPPFFRCTSSSEMAAGVTPVMRDAWPSVSGGDGG